MRAPQSSTFRAPPFRNPARLGDHLPLLPHPPRILRPAPMLSSTRRATRMVPRGPTPCRRPAAASRRPHQTAAA
eukprot:5347064-Prymnesium_polylepis.1